MIWVKFDKDTYMRGEEAVITFSKTRLLTRIVITDSQQHKLHDYRHKALPRFYISGDALLGTYTTQIIGLRGEELARDTMEVIEGTPTPDPTRMNKREFIAGIQARGIIKWIGLPSLGVFGEWRKSSVSDGISYIATGNRRALITNLSTHNPPIDVVDIFFSDGDYFADVYSVPREWALTALDKLEFITDLLCLWVIKIGIKNLSAEHALYAFFKAIGANRALEVVYNRMSPKPEPLETIKRDQALGIFYYSQGAITSGNTKTGCGF